MKPVRMASCPRCGGTLMLALGQRRAVCHFCGSPFHAVTGEAPVVVLRNRETDDSIRQRWAQIQMDHRFSPRFRIRSRVERIQLLYIPVWEVQGLRRPLGPLPEASDQAVRAHSFGYLRLGHRLQHLPLELEADVVEEDLLEAEQEAYVPQTLHRSARVLIPQVDAPPPPLLGEQGILEQETRLLYYPVWEVVHPADGVVYRSYFSGINGRLLRAEGLANPGRQVLGILLGWASSSVLLGKVLAFNLLALRLGVAAIFGLPFLFLLLTLLFYFMLFPFFWRRLIARDLLIIDPRGDRTEPLPDAGDRPWPWERKMDAWLGGPSEP